MSFATKRLTAVGEQVIVAVVETMEGRVYENSVVFDVVDISLDQLQIGAPTVSVSDSAISELLSNEETYKLYSSLESIAQLRKVSLERQSFDAAFDGRFGKFAKVLPAYPVERYRTSVSRTTQIDISVDPPGFSPLIEWRIDNEAPMLATTTIVAAREPGVRTISVGPPTRARQIEIETYSVAITSHLTNNDIVGEGEVIVFEAVTDPPGYEADITWLSSTKYGTVWPILGSGPTFTVQFDDTWGDDPVIGNFQWLGVKADSTTFNQDQKAGACCSAGQCEDSVTQSACVSEDREFQGDGSLCADVTCPPTGACCNQDSCTLGYSAVCLDAGGTYLGDETVCDPGVCDLGACCVDETCDESTAIECYSIGGIFGGPDAPCVDMCVNAAAACSPTTKAPTNGNCPMGYTTVSLGLSTNDFDGHRDMCLKCTNNSCQSPATCVATRKSTALGGVTAWVADCPCE